MEATTCLEILSICSIIVFCAHSLPTMDCQENEYWDQWGRCVTCQLCGPGQELSKVNTPGQDTYFPDTDFPLYRLADVYLMYAECAIQGATGANLSTALDYVNDLRERAGLGRDIEAYQLTLDFIRDERARELYWEGHRRTDLIRLNSFIDSDYNWNWKGGAKMGVKVADPKLKLYPIPAAERSVNPNLEQNEGY